jgi:protein involved in polysaccharide export with SLBB domain
MSVPGDTNAREIPVREGPLVELAPGIPALSLAGVLRSELTPLVLSHLAKYIREPDVRVWMLQRVGIFGAVGRPGVYWVPRDVVLSELPMRAGGLTAGARLDKARVVRDGREVVNAKTFARLSRDGRTVDEAGLRAGDEIRVPERAQRNWAQVATYAFFGISALTALLALVRSSYQ